MKEAVKIFLADKNANQLPQFFEVLKDEVSDYIFLVTRKGFWVYTVLSEEDKSMRFVKSKLYTDRYLLKATDHKFVDGKTVILADDTLSNGFNLFRYYCILKRAGSKRIIPAAYALSTEFPRSTLDDKMLDIYYDIYDVHPKDKEIEEKKARKIWKEFKEVLYCYRYLCQENISLLCIKEVELFQQSLCPFVVDLPMMVTKENGGSILRDHFVLSNEQFHHLCGGNEHWNYVPNIYEIYTPVAEERSEIGNQRSVIQCNYFEYQDTEINRLKTAFLQNAVVKCKYVEEGNQYRIVFTPFAIVRSCDKKELWQTFLSLLQDTAYGKQLEQKESLDRYDWIGVFRAVIYALSLYVGEEFRQYLKLNEIYKSGYDWDIMDNIAESVFIDSMKQMWRTGVKLNKIMISDFCSKQDKSYKLSIQKEKFTYKRAYTRIKNRIADRGKNENIYIEDLENELDQYYRFQNDCEKRRGFSSILLMMLENSTCSNYISITEDCVKRGFRHGENSALLLSRSEKLCHICSDVLYISLGLDFFIKKISEFLEIMQQIIFNGHDYDEEDIHEDEFQTYSLIIKGMAREDVHYKMMGKRFLVRNLQGLEQKVQNKAIDIAQKFAAEGRVWS